ncbi:hypothetical protein CIL05_09720 [Virgibacillus profundi]|uniref:DUF485 domain-containing protein n=1 Tax=Virgibacillus profundi TaxID=2024555 RepID=A0A2A2IDJ0_9BACI|nr:DUF485 domain-containing protein [Virgibacillus profundi]PAV29642.1 hypothetical protein CIL05_09720 [Virgibacillus profundi]PXY53814.1 DUF485 domain-containing protein [Virgibacillus profundi]
MNGEHERVETLEKNEIDYVEVAKSSQFKSFIEGKRKFIVPLTIFFLVFYFLLPLLTSYTTFLNTPLFGDISWVWLFAVSQFIMVWVLSTIYVKRAASFDKEADQIIEDQIKKGGNS